MSNMRNKRLEPRPPLISNILKSRLSSFYSRNEMADVNLLSKQDYHRYSTAPAVQLGVYSPKESDCSSFNGARDALYKEAAIGDLFGPSWSTHWFKVTLNVLEEVRDADCVEFHFDCEGEGLVYGADGTPLQGLTGGLVDRRVEFIVPPAWLKASKELCFYIEVGMNGMFGNGLDLPSAPPKSDREFELRMADLVVPNMTARRLLWDVMVIKDAIDHLPENTYAGHDALRVANDLMNAFKDGSDESMLKARACASKFLGDNVDDHTVYSGTDFTVTGIGHCHIDTAWLWSYGETHRKIARSWSAQCDLMDRYPEHRMCVSQARQFQWVKDDYPALWDRIQEHVKAGRFQPIGGTWTEMDANLPSGESFIRQFLYGQRFFLENFGSRSRTFWLPDTFGYSAQLPQIARQCGIDNFFTQKLSWNNMNVFPRTTFNWVGLDGSSLLTHMAPSENYCSRADIEDLQKSVTKHKDLRYSKAALVPYGFGDGGGGPTPEQLEKLRRLRGLANTNPGAIPKHHIGISVDDFFDQIRAETNDANDLDSFVGELYLEFHRGTYTSEAFVKKSNRLCEQRLRDLELLATLATVHDPACKYPHARLAKVWETVLLNQFHDVLPGTSIEIVYDDVLEMYRWAFAEIDHLTHRALADLGLEPSVNGDSRDVDANLAVLNTLPWDRCDVVAGKDVGLTKGRHASQSFTSSQVPALGLSPHMPGSRIINDSDAVAVNQKGPNIFSMRNGCLDLTIEGHLITSFIDLREGRQILFQGKSLNELVLFDDRPPGADAWDVETYHLESRKALPEGSARILTDSPQRCSIEVTTKISEVSWIKSIISMNHARPGHPDNGQVEIECEVEWRENRKFLKAEFPINCYSPRATYETQYGVLERPTHFNTMADAAKFEVCAHRFADLSDSGYGVSILNDCKYGFSTHGSTMRLSLLRSTKAPNGTADMGRHHFRYAILPHNGNFQHNSTSITRAAYNFNHPMRLVRANPDAIARFNDLSSHLFRVDGSASVILDTIKRSEDDMAIIVRLYESSGGQGPVELSTGLKVKNMYLSNGLEDPLTLLSPQVAKETSTAALLFEPFEIVTIRIDLA